MEVQRKVGASYSALVVSLRSLNTQVNAIGLQGQSIPLILATLDQIDLNIGEITDRLWALRALVEAESGQAGA